MTSQGTDSELADWYLARLRNNARQSSDLRKLTPLTLVESDKTRIQQIVMKSHTTLQQRGTQLLKQIYEQNEEIRHHQAALLWMMILGIAYFFGLALLFK